MNNTDFTDLHVHSSFSLLDGTATPERIAEETAKLGRKYLSISDHGSVDSWVEHTLACKKYDIKPIYGIELYMLEDFENRKSKQQKNLHLTAIAKTEEGQKKLIQACGFAYSEGMGKWGIMKRPFLTMDYPLKNGWAGDIIICTGCANSPFWNAENGIGLLKDYYDAFKSDLYTELMPNCGWEPQNKINALALEYAKHLAIKSIATCDVHYICKDDSDFHNVVIGLQQGSATTYKNQKWKFETHDNFIHTTDEIYDAFKTLSLDEETIRKIIINTQEIAEKTVHNLKSTPVQLPNVLNTTSDEDEHARFEQYIVSGFDALQLPNNDEYFDRLDKEIKVIRQRNLVRYFLMVQDVVQWAKSNGVFVGPSRGSVGGSLVAYCLGITNLDPIKYGLFFERFLAPGRYDYPDIDLDIDSRNRNLVEHYLKQKYGNDNVAHISTFGRLMGRSAIRDVARYYEVPLVESDKMAKSVIHKYEGEEGTDETIKLTLEEKDPYVLEFAEKYPKVVKYAIQLEGLAKSYGVHASGYVISKESLKNSTRCYLADRNGQQTVNWSGPDLEYMGFIKLDLLGLSTLSAIAECVDLIKKNHNVSLDMTKIPMDDKKTFDMMYKGQTATVFHFNTPGYTKYCKELKPDNFRHMAAVLALWKPGPIAAGMTEGYMKCKLGLEKPVYYSEAYKKITEETYGFIIYQEQIVRLLTDLAGFDYTAADKVRKTISKKLGLDKLQEIEEPFVQGCVKRNTLDEDTARELWKQLVFFGVYVFNKSHSVGYGMLAYWTAYLKAHYPTEWICAYLNYGSTEKEDKKTGEKNIDVALREAKRLGITIKTPDINKSEVIWSTDGSALRVGLKDIVFVGAIAQADIAKMKAAGRIVDFDSFLNRRDKDSSLDKRVVKSLVYCGAFNECENKTQWYNAALNDFDNFWEKRSKKSFQQYLDKAEWQPVTQEFLSEQRAELLKFNSLSVDDGTTLRKMAEITGMRVEKTEEDEYFLISPNGDRFTRSQAEMCDLPNTGLKLVHAVDVNLNGLKEANRECRACDLRKNCKMPVPIGTGQLDLLIVGEASGYYEDKFNKPLVGKVGEKLWEMLEEYGIERNMVCVANTIPCRAKDGEKPTSDQIKGCEWLGRYIKALKPKFILSLGNMPLQYFTNKESGIMSMSGVTEWHPKYNCWITYSITPGLVSYKPENMGLLQKGLDEWWRVVSQFL